jgi:hypothetical protein
MLHPYVYIITLLLCCFSLGSPLPFIVVSNNGVNSLDNTSLQQSLLLLLNSDDDSSRSVITSTLEQFMSMNNEAKRDSKPLHIGYMVFGFESLKQTLSSLMSNNDLMHELKVVFIRRSFYFTGMCTKYSDMENILLLLFPSSFLHPPPPCVLPLLLLLLFFFFFGEGC